MLKDLGHIEKWGTEVPQAVGSQSCLEKSNQVKEQRNRLSYEIFFPPMDWRKAVKGSHGLGKNLNLLISSCLCSWRNVLNIALACIPSSSQKTKYQHSDTRKCHSNAKLRLQLTNDATENLVIPGCRNKHINREIS